MQINTIPVVHQQIRHLTRKEVNPREFLKSLFKVCPPKVKKWFEKLLYKAMRQIIYTLTFFKVVEYKNQDVEVASKDIQVSIVDLLVTLDGKPSKICQRQHRI